MNTSPNQPNLASRFLRRSISALKLCFWSGPRLLFTSRLSPRNAGFMITAAIPALLCATAMTVPAIVFSSPDSNAYFYFGRILQSDPLSWIPMSVAAICTFMALAFPTERPARPFLQQA